MIDETNIPDKPFLPEDDLLWRQIKTIPAFRGVLRAIEARFYFAVDLPGPVLDLGCGDGHFAQMTFDRKLDVGLDPWWNPLKKGHQSEAYNLVLQGMGDKMPFPDKTFASAFSNSVLEHIPDIQPVLNETSRVLQENGRFLITMPSQYFTQELGGAQFFEKMNMDGMANQYRKFFNGIARHEHTDGPEVWATRLAQAGFAIERWQYYFSTEALHALELGHIQGLPSAVMHALTGTWVVAPWESSLKLTEKWVRPFYDEETAAETGTCILIVAQKKADGPIPMELPPANPFTVTELETAVANKLNPPLPAKDDTDNNDDAGAELLLATSETPPQPTSETTHQNHVSVQEETTPAKRFDLLTAGLLGFTLLFALIGQKAIADNPLMPWTETRWFLFSFISLFLLTWRIGSIQVTVSKWPRPTFNLHSIPIKRWLYLLALGIGYFAFLQANSAQPWPAWITLCMWLFGIFIAFYSLHENDRVDGERNNAKSLRKFIIPAGIILFLTALIVRYAGLSSHPWILNGFESSLGLDIQNIASGFYRHPFSTSWLTAPTLPLFLMALPVKFLGSTLVSIRFLSPIIGALTVLATFLIGTKLWRLEVGLGAAIFLIGSHFHIHYSRLGIPAIWDGLLLLLALGSLGIAWKKSKTGNGKRSTWMWAGFFIGLNIYAQIPSLLLPIILILLSLVGLFWQRQTILSQFRNILAAFAIALIVALPQIVYYNTHSGLFLRRFNELSIFSDQTNWLSQQANLTSQSQVQILGQQIQKSLLTFNMVQDNSPAFGSDTSLLGGGLILLFVLGIMIAILRFKQHQYLISLFWLFVPLVWGGMLIQSPSSHRLVGILPVVCLLAAVALVEVIEWVLGLIKNNGQPTEKSQQLVLPVVLIVTAIIAFTGMLYYFGEYRQSHDFADRNTEIAYEMAEYLNTLDGSATTAYFYGPPSMFINFPTIPFLAEEFTGNVNLYDVAPETETAVLPEAHTPSLTFVILPERAREIEELEAAFPGGSVQTIPGFHANPLFYTYEVTP